MSLEALADYPGTVRTWDSTSIALHLIDLAGQAVNTGAAMGRLSRAAVAGAAEL